MAAIDTLLATWIWGGSLAKPYQDRKHPEGVVGAAVCLGHTVTLKANNNNKGTLKGGFNFAYVCVCVCLATSDKNSHFSLL